MTTISIGFIVAVGFVLLVLSVVGFRATLAAVLAANRAVLLGLFLAVICWLGTWTVTLSLVLQILDIEHGSLDSVLLFGDVLFANSIAPSTYLGGEPLAAFLLTRHTGSDFETSFATVSSLDLLNYAPMVPLAGIGLMYFAATAALGRRIELALLAVFAVFGLLLGGIWYGWRHRNRTVDLVAGILSATSTGLSALVPGVYAVSPVRFQQRLELFVTEVEQVTADQRNLKRALVYSTTGWVFLSSALWLALYAIGYAVSPEVVLFVVPLGAVTNVLPLPGGLGSVESVFIVLLVAAAAVPAPEATAATLLYRAGTYWLPLLFSTGTVLVSHSRVV